jgi:hypothetical protein
MGANYELEKYLKSKGYYIINTLIEAGYFISDIKVTL